MKRKLKDFIDYHRFTVKNHSKLFHVDLKNQRLIINPKPNH